MAFINKVKGARSMFAFLATDCPLLCRPSPDVGGNGGVNPHTLTQDLLQVGQLGDGVVGSLGVQAGQLAVYLPLKFLLDPGVGGQQEGGEQQGGRCGLVPGEDEDELVSHDLVLSDEIVSPSSLHTQLESVHWSNLGRIGLAGMEDSATSLYDDLVGPFRTF